MKAIFSFRNCSLILAGPLLSSLSVYLILSQLLLFPSNITVTLSIILFSLLLGLSTYLQVDRFEKRKKRNDFVQKNINEDTHYWDQKISLSNLIFIVVYTVSIIIVGTSKPFDITGEIFTAWNDFFTSTQIVQLVAAALLSFFFPGYAFVYLLGRVYKLESLPKFLLSFLFSMLLTGFIVYVAAIMVGVPALYLNQIIIGVNVMVLILFIIYLKTKNALSFDLGTFTSFFYQSESKLRMIVQQKKNVSLFIIFASLFALVAFYTYYLEKGVIVGDQWFHHGRALLINSGNFKEVVSTGADWSYPPFFSAVLAGYFSISGVSSVNAYVSIHFLNMMPVFAFYYFFTRWIPSNQRKAVVLAATLFVVSSGFGWIQVLETSLTDNNPSSEQSSLHNVYQASLRSFDIRTPSTFFNVGGHPTFSTPLIIIGLPAGFVMLGLLKEEKGKKSSLGFISIITAITVLGIVSHDEFYLFILVGSILTLLFRLSYGNLIYASIISAIFICFLIDFWSPQRYYTFNSILNVPLLILCLIFASVLWGLYITRILGRLHNLISERYNFLKTEILNSSSKKAVAIVIVSVLAYLYLFTFIVLEDLSTKDIRLHLGFPQVNLPWYLYPMKFGVAGLLGLAFIVSYLFRKFEKVIFVFGVIAIAALFAGPYYNEHRFSKYVMVGMVGFASILVYEMILWLQHPNNDLRHHHSHPRLEPLAFSILLGIVVTSAALSVFMLTGYKELANYNAQFREIFYRVHFLSPSEINLLNFLRSELPYLKTDYVALHGTDWRTGKLFSKIESFTGISRNRILENPQFLNAPTLEGLYTLLDDKNIKYIILLKKDFYAEKQFPKPIDFASSNFQHVYHDDSYIILKVPDLAPPSSGAAVDIGLIYNKRNELPPPLAAVSNGNNDGAILQYSYKFFNNIENNSEFVEIKKGTENSNDKGNETNSNDTETLTLYGDRNGKTLWSNPIKQENNVNYVEGKFRLIAVNSSINDFGIKLEDDRNKQEYYVSLDKDSLDLKQKSNLENISNKELLLSKRQITPEYLGISHTLKILVLKDTINVYLDDILKIKVPKAQSAENFNSIYKIGIRANKNIVQFEPLKIGYLSEPSLKSYQKSHLKGTYNHHYYPLSAFALSKLRYNAFVDGDFSVFSKKYVVLASDPKLELVEGKKTAVEEKEVQDEQLISEDEFNKYLEFVKSGGTLIVMNPKANSNNHSSGNESKEGAFSKFLSIRYGDKIGFNGIISNIEKSVNRYQQQQEEEQEEKKGLVRNKMKQLQQHFINISGVATNIEFSNSRDIGVKSYYVNIGKDNNSKKVAPFAIEKKYGEGKLVLVNSAAYFDSLFNSKDQQFITISDIPKMIGLESKSYYDISPIETAISTLQGIKDQMKISNYTSITIKSTSLLPYNINGKAPPYNLTLNKISTSPHTALHIEKSNYNSNPRREYLNENTNMNQDNILNNITIRDLKLSGRYEASINTTDNLVSFSSVLSNYDYIAILIPTGFDMLLKLSEGAYAEFTLLSCENNGDCKQQSVRISDVAEIYFRNIKADSQSISSIPILMKSPELMIVNGTARLENKVTQGNISANFDHVENYDLFRGTETKTEYVTYFKSLDMPGYTIREDRKEVKVTLLLPGDISDNAKEKGVWVPWERTMVSFKSIIIMMSITVTVIAIFYLSPKMKKYKRLY